MRRKTASQRLAPGTAYNKVCADSKWHRILRHHDPTRRNQASCNQKRTSIDRSSLDLRAKRATVNYQDAQLNGRNEPRLRSRQTTSPHYGPNFEADCGIPTQGAAECPLKYHRETARIVAQLAFLRPTSAVRVAGVVCSAHLFQRFSLSLHQRSWPGLVAPRSL